MSDWITINKGRCREGRFGTTDADGFNGFFRLFVCHEWFKIIASDGEGWKHVSVSRLEHSNKVPSWEVMCAIKDLFFEPEDWVVQFHPARSQYVNTHPGCLHLWKPTEAIMPTPKRNMVG